MADIVGGPGDDILDGTDSADVISGNGGNDQIDGKGGNDRLYGDDGDDVVHGGDGNDELSGGIGVNQLYGDDGDDRIILDGFVLNGSGYIFDGGAGSDVLSAEGGDLSGATVIGIEAVTTYGATLAMTIEQMNGFSNIGYSNSLLDTAGYRLTNGGSISFNGKSVAEGRFDLANADTVFDLTGVVVVQGPVFEPSFPPEGYTVNGGSGADTIKGAQTHDHFYGKGGNDVLDGAAGNDVLEGGIGDDIIDGGIGNDILYGSAGLDILLGGDGNDELHADGDLVAGEIYDGGAGVDRIYLNRGNYDLNALGVTFANIEGIYLAAGGRLAMTTAQLGQFSSLVGGTYILTTAGTVALPGAIASGATFILSDLGNGFDLGLSDRSATVTGGASADYIIGSAFNDILAGGGGDDVILGGNGNDQLTGGTGTNRLSGGTGNDTYYLQSSADLVFEDAGGGLDKIFIPNDFYLYANVENLTLTGSGNYFGVGNDLANTISGNGGENLLIAGAGDDIVSGGAGRDSIFGEDGADRLFGETGIDYIVAGAGNDIVDGGADADEIYGGDGADVLTGGTGFFTDIIVGGLGNDTLRGDSGLGDYDLLYGNTGDDVFYVDTPDDLVFENAGEGTDTVYARIEGAGYYLYDNVENLFLDGNTPFGVGNALANRIAGSDSANYLLGGAGNDTLNGWLGNDVLFGEAGNDIFVFTRRTGADVIGDFTRGQDRIDLSAFGITSLSQVSNFFAQNGNVGAIQFASGEVIVLHNVQMNQLTAGDFIFAAAAKEAGASAGKAAFVGPAFTFEIHSPAAEGQWHGGAFWTPLDYSIPAWFG